MLNENVDLIVVISGPSGVGKTTIGKLVEESEELKGRIKRIPTCTTRAPRPGEKDGEDYIFLSKAEFAIGLNKGLFLEWVEIFGNFYGTSIKEIEKITRQGRIPLLIIDVRGGQYVKSLYKDKAVTIFIMPPSEEELKRRLSQRGGSSKEELDLRLGIAHEEMMVAEQYDYVVVNDKLELAVREVVDIILKEITRRKDYDRSKDLGKDEKNIQDSGQGK